MRWLLMLLLGAQLAGASTYIVAAGVEKYDDPGIVALKYAVADATSLVKAFEARQVPAENIQLLTSAAPDFAARPTRSNVLAALQKVRRQAVAGDTVIFIFSGHGMEVDGQAYLLTVDSSRELLTDTALPLPLVHEALRGLQAENLLFVIDACRNDPTSSKAIADAELAEPFAKGLRPKVADQGQAQAKNIAVLTACDVGQRAWELPDEGHGVFTYYLLRALAGEAPAAEDGQLQLGMLANYLEQQVAAWGERARREQTPKLIFAHGQDFPVTRVPIRTPDPEPVPQAKLSLDSDPSGAEVRLDDELLGKTPLTITRTVAAGFEGRLTLSLAGHQPHEQPLRLEPGQTLALPRISLRAIAVVPPEPVRPAGDLGHRPAGWPAFLRDYQLPAGRTWHDFRIRKADGMPQVRIPAGEFTMGDPDLRSTQRKTTVGEFWIDVHEVTLDQYCSLAEAKQVEMPLQITDRFRRENPHLPMYFVNFDQARTYAGWVGGRLPTAVEWERAARGGVEGTVFPWGNSWDTTLANGNDKRAALPSIVGQYAPNGFGLLDVIGNVAEWCAGIDGGLPEVRGGAFLSSDFSLKLHAGVEESPDKANRITGFRCVQD